MSNRTPLYVEGSTSYFVREDTISDSGTYLWLDAQPTGAIVEQAHFINTLSDHEHHTLSQPSFSVTETHQGYIRNADSSEQSRVTAHADPNDHVLDLSTEDGIPSDANTEHRPPQAAAWVLASDEYQQRFVDKLANLWVDAGGDTGVTIALPEGYALFRHQRAGIQKRHDTYLYGHPGYHVFRSPLELLEGGSRKG